MILYELSCGGGHDGATAIMFGPDDRERGEKQIRLAVKRVIEDRGDFLTPQRVCEHLRVMGGWEDAVMAHADLDAIWMESKK